MKKDYTTGPFGTYGKGMPGHILNALCHFGIPLRIVDNCAVTVGENGFFKLLTSDGKEFARANYFETIDQPLFAFTDTHYHSLQDEEGNYQLTFYHHHQPSLILHGGHSKDVYPVINACMSNDIRDEVYRLKTDARIFFQSGSGDENSDFYYLSFMDPAKAQLWLDYFNTKVKEYRAEIDAKTSDQDHAAAESTTFNKFIPESQEASQSGKGLKYSLEAVAIAAFDKDYFTNHEKYKHLRYGQAFHDHFKLDKMNKGYDHRLSLIYQLDGDKAKKLIHEMFDFT